jgi:putative transposase
VILIEFRRKISVRSHAMTAGPSIDMPGWLHEHLGQASPDLLREMIRSFAQALMSAEADSVCGAGYGERSDDRTNTCNGYRTREWDTWAGSIDLQVPELRQGSYSPAGCWSGAGGPRPPWSRS